VAVRLELILTRERSFNTLRSGVNIMAFGKGGKSRIALDLSFKFEVAGAQARATYYTSSC